MPQRQYLTAKMEAAGLTGLKIAVIDVVLFEQATERTSIGGGPLRGQRNVAVAADHDRAKIIVFEPFEDLCLGILERQIAEKIGAF